MSGYLSLEQQGFWKPAEMMQGLQKSWEDKRRLDWQMKREAEKDAWTMSRQDRLDAAAAEAARQDKELKDLQIKQTKQALTKAETEALDAARARKKATAAVPAGAASKFFHELGGPEREAILRYVHGRYPETFADTDVIDLYNKTVTANTGKKLVLGEPNAIDPTSPPPGLRLDEATQSPNGPTYKFGRIPDASVTTPPGFIPTGATVSPEGKLSQTFGPRPRPSEANIIDLTQALDATRTLKKAREAFTGVGGIGTGSWTGWMPNFLRPGFKDYAAMHRPKAGQAIAEIIGARQNPQAVEGFQRMLPSESTPTERGKGVLQAYEDQAKNTVLARLYAIAAQGGDLSALPPSLIEDLRAAIPPQAAEQFFGPIRTTPVQAPGSPSTPQGSTPAPSVGGSAAVQAPAVHPEGDNSYIQSLQAIPEADAAAILEAEDRRAAASGKPPQQRSVKLRRPDGSVYTKTWVPVK